MTIRHSAFLTAGLLGGLILVGSFASVHAGEGCTKDRKDKDKETTTLACPATGTLARYDRGAVEGDRQAR